MCVPVPAVSHVRELTETFLPHLRPAQQRGLAEWVSGVLAAKSGCEAAVLAALEPLGVEPQALRARLREVLCDGSERAAPCATSLEVEACFAPLLAWVLAWWTGETLPLAIDATSLRDRAAAPSPWPGWCCRTAAKGNGCPIWRGCWGCWPRPCPPP